MIQKAAIHDVNILFATTEAVPFCKTGGLGDVCGALPLALEKLGLRPTLIMPAFRHTFQSGRRIDPTGIRFEVKVGEHMVAGEFLRSTLPGSEIPVYLVEQDCYFNREQLYRETDGDYRDNSERFIFFNRAVIEAIKLMKLKPDVLHCHDWQTGMLPVYLKTTCADDPTYQDIATLFTIHNLAYQGNFWHWDMDLTGLGWEHFNWAELEFHGQLNFLKSGLVFSDKINTVSPRYATEIQSPPMSCGLEGVLGHRANDLSGILNGVDYDAWNPATDSMLNFDLGATNFDATNFETGKANCKRALQRELGLPERDDVPMLASVGRLADQKGFDLIAESLPRFAEEEDMQWVMLGTGERHYEDLLREISAKYPEKVAVRIGFSNELAHRIEAGTDMFLMPSRYEPCGLNQMYSLKYGAVPIVRETGGLADTITNAWDETLKDGTANGFSFADTSSYALSLSIERACKAYTNKEVWHQIVRTGMLQDWSWDRSAVEYAKLYEATCQAVSQTSLLEDQSN